MALAFVAPSFYYDPLIIIGDMFFVFGTCKLLAAMIDDIETELQTLNEPQEINRSIHKVIEMHSTIKQLGKNGFMQTIQVKLFTNQIIPIILDSPQISVIQSGFIVRCIFCG